MHSRYLIQRLQIVTIVASLSLLTQFLHRSVAELSDHLHFTTGAEMDTAESQFRLFVALKFQMALADAPHGLLKQAGRPGIPTDKTNHIENTNVD